MSENDNIGPFAGLGGQWKVVWNVFGRIGVHFDAEIVLELATQLLHCGDPIRVHPNR